MSDHNYHHETVLLHPAVDALITDENGIYIDATFGGGGHTLEILKRLGPKGKLFSFDQDENVKNHLPQDARFTWIQSNFRYLQKYMEFYKIEKINGLLADLGISSHHIDSDERGFSFQSNAPLDMRMNTNQSLTAMEIINTYPEEKLIDVIRNYGEITNAPTIVKKLMVDRRSRKMISCKDLADWLKPFMYGKPNKFLAQFFQALRIEVNQELVSLKELLEQGTDLMQEKSRLVVISFHSLEDRIVKEWMKENVADEKEKMFGKVKRRFELMEKEAITPNEEEISRNTRSRSAKMRVGIKK